MSNFKNQLKDDLSTFINSDEFSEEHIIEGVTVQAVFQGLTSKDLITSISRHPAEFEGLDGRTVVIHLKTDDLPDAVVNENVIEVDGEMYRVIDVTDDMGITTITLGVDAA